MYFEYGTKEIEYLKSRDKLLGEAIDRIGPIYREVDNHLFSSVVHHIIGQQISTSAQATVWKRLCEELGEVNADTVCSCNRDKLNKCGMTFKKADYILDFSKKIKDKQFDLEFLKTLTDEEVIKELSALKGIGIWTAEMIMIFCMQRSNILSFGDLAIHRGMRMLYHHRNIDRKKFEKYAKRYAPYGTTASLYLWAIAGGAIPEMRDYAPKKKKINAVRLEEKKMDKGFAVYETEFGLLQFEYENDKIIGIEKLERGINNNSKQTPLTDWANQELIEYFKGKRKEFSFPYELKGTEFQKKVWQALCEIPYGETRTYKEIAIQVGNPKASRAVGMANNKNPIMIAVPCHRVIGSSGKMVGYANGIDMKKDLLNLEKTNRIL